ncbi:flagellar biosynthetic protein FliO [Salinibacterium sp. ZJ454]|uniref:FliO/MopB family protein n=1 Tax=Salinibacterium sp. ZJ454 TaxID=2708339 RepID=UPI00142331E5|nr:flagellar biosynthetic protein FliO [Salinibacterium sp. ZJ454]
MDTLLLALRVLLSLGVVFGLLWVMQRRMTRGGRGGRGKDVATPIRVIGRQRLGAKASVVVVELQGKKFMLGVTEQSVNVLHAEIGTATPVPLSSEPTPAEEFARSMRQVSASPSADTSADATTDAATPESATSDTPSPLLRPRRDRPSNALGGSILSPHTWKQTADVLRQRR